METRFLIIDGNSLACRAAFAHNPKFGPDLQTKDGKMLNTDSKGLYIYEPDSIIEVTQENDKKYKYIVSNNHYRCQNKL